MDKRKVDALIPAAYAVLETTGIATNGMITKTWRGQISTFGAAIATGSLISAIAYFNHQGSATVDRALLMEAIAKLIGKENLYKYALDMQEDCIKEMQGKENILNAAIALKLAMNLYQLV